MNGIAALLYKLDKRELTIVEDFAQGAILAERFQRCSVPDNDTCQSRRDFPSRPAAATGRAILIADARGPDNPTVFVNRAFERFMPSAGKPGRLSAPSGGSILVHGAGV